MKYLILFTTFGLLLNSCQQPMSDTPPVATKDTVVIIQRDTIVIVQKDTPPAVSVVTAPMPKREKLPIEPKITKLPDSDTTFHYYVNKKISVKITPWLNGERWVLLYNLLGEETYRHEDIRKSYTVFAHLKFHPNGAVSKMEINDNPGASMYWHETTITFSTTNDPEQKTSERKPYEAGPNVNKPWEYWDKKTKQWRKQEVQE